jgi:hypothetical protein
MAKFDTVRRDDINTWKLLTVIKARIHLSGIIEEFQVFVNDLWNLSNWFMVHCVKIALAEYMEVSYGLELG